MQQNQSLTSSSCGAYELPQLCCLPLDGDSSDNGINSMTLKCHVAFLIETLNTELHYKKVMNEFEIQE